MGSTRNTLRSGASLGVLALVAPVALLATAAQADVTISSGATQNMTCSGGVCSPTAKNAVLNVSDLEGMLASGSVEVKTKKLENIKVDSSLTWATSNTLTLDAYDSIAIEAPVLVTGRGGVTLLTNDGGSTGTLAFYKKGHVAFSKLSSHLAIDGSAYALVGDIATLAGDIATNPNGNYALARSYNASGDGTYPSAPIATIFDGTFEGLGNTISNLTIVDGTQEGASDGLFVLIRDTGIVRDFGLVNASVTSTGGQGGNSVGTLAGSGGTFWRVFATGAVSCGDFCFAGGLVAGDGSPISQSHADVAINCGINYAACNAGGLVGNYDGNVTLSQSYATGAITVGGTGAGGGSVGGLVGGINAAGISQSYATGAVSLTDPNTYFSYGGLVGNSGDTPISQSYSTGKVSVPNSDCSGNFCVGGLIGFDGSSTGSLTDTYWDTTTSGITDPSQGAGNVPNDPGIAGQTDKKLQSGLPTGFDSNVWTEKATINGGLPYLLANPPPK